MHGHTRCKNGCSSDTPRFVGPFTGFRQSEAQPCLLVPMSELKIQLSKVGLEPARADAKKAALLNRKCDPSFGYQNPAPKRVRGTARAAINRRVPPRFPKREPKTVIIFGVGIWPQDGGFPVSFPAPPRSFLASDMVPLMASKTTPLSTRNRVGIAGPLLPLPPSPVLYHPWP